MVETNHNIQLQLQCRNTHSHNSTNKILQCEIKNATCVWDWSSCKKKFLFYYMHEKMNKQNTTRIKNKNNTS